MMRIRQENVPKIRQIVLVSHSVLQRMFSINRGKIQKVQVDDMPRLCYRPPPHTLYSFSWCSAWVDEAHESRTGKALWRSISAIFEVSLAKVLITATPLLEQPEDLMNLALLVRPPSMNFKEQANMRFMTRDLRLVKSRTTIKTHQDALELMARDRIVPQTEGGAVALLSSTMVKVVQRHLVPHTVRRSNNSVDNQGTRLSALLPPCTIMHVSVEVTNEESQASYEELEKDAVTGRHFDVATLGRFFNDGRLKLSFPNPGKWTPDEYNEAALNSDSATKLKCLIELCRAILLNGAEAVVPTEYHGSQDRILDTATFGLPDLIQGYRLRPLKKEEKNREKIIVYTTFAKFHLYMTKTFEAAGISVVAISGAITARDRTKRIERFMMDPDINVLLMSVVGQTGLNLTAGRVLILYEANWSNVQSRQLYGRVYRRGQKRSTFIFQLMAAKTVEVLLIANGLGKHQLLADFLKVKRNEATLKLLAGRASQEEIDALLEGRDADDELALEVKSQLKSAKSAVGVAMRDRIAQGEQQKKGEGKQNPSDKEEHASTEEEVPRKYKRKQKDAEEPPSKKLKGEDTAKSTPRGSG
ncbi:P-loop containing nucleoside triphosphate hydrolase protein [Rhodocollybia butyracea]|uniref:P-loop containing nucleoside triphosphate hydrolase protein n=1 Tax=Rhodocollybia butyracea TaxID=206335 RepID=A0A9P5PJ16_9AGAR|nr:P-loop containing nucleoside triphosphate hydrolase protein [Rhodocollybia butyracea]